MDTPPSHQPITPITPNDPSSELAPPYSQDEHRNRLNLNTKSALTEIRRDYIHDYYVLVAPKRRGRPYDAATRDHPLVESANSPRLDLQTEVEHLDGPDGTWAVKVVENKFPALTLDNARAYGDQEIVIDTPIPNIDFGQLDIPQIILVLQTYQNRYKALSAKPHIKYVSIFRNDGYEAGASLAHAHSQIYALPFIPPQLVRESQTVEAYWESKQQDPYEAILAYEQKQKLRIIHEDDLWLSFCPYASLWQMEAWVMPKRNVTTLTDLTTDELQSAASHLKMLSKKLSDTDISYNLCVEQGISAHQRLVFKLRGRNVVSPWGGLEVSTGLIINTIPPEAAAEWYRS